MPLASIVPRVRGAAMAFVAGLAICGSVLWLAVPAPDIRVRVRWDAGLADSERLALEDLFGLREGEHDEGSTLVYRLENRSSANIRAIVEHPAVEDTDGLNRAKFRPFNAYQRETRVAWMAGVSGLGIAALWLIGPLAAHRLQQPTLIDARAASLAIMVPGLLLVLVTAYLLAGVPFGLDPMWDREPAAQAAPDDPGIAPDVPPEPAESIEATEPVTEA